MKYRHRWHHHEILLAARNPVIADCQIYLRLASNTDYKNRLAHPSGFYPAHPILIDLIP